MPRKKKTESEEEESKKEISEEEVIIEEEKKEEKKKKTSKTKDTLVPVEDYIKCGVHLGTKVITPHMRKFVYKRRADGLAVLNTLLIDEKIREAVEFLNKFEPQNIFLTCKREAGWKAAEKFSEVTGIRIFTKKYPAGIITNLVLSDFFETELVIICDPWIDKNAISDAVKMKKPILGICDTNNYTQPITKVIPANNKSGKSIGLVLYILARGYIKSRGQEKEAKKLSLEDFTGKIEEVVFKTKKVKEGV